MTVIALNTAARKTSPKPAGASCAIYRADMHFASKQRQNLRDRNWFTHQRRTHTKYYSELLGMYCYAILDTYTFMSANDGEFTVTRQYERDAEANILCSTWYAEVDGHEYDFNSQAELADFLDNGRWR